jgi:hypothetical protein
MKSFILFVSLCLISLNYSAAQCLNVNYQQVKNQPVYKSTGNAALDKVLNTEKANLENVFKVKVDLKILDDSQSPNAYATSESSNPFFFDGTVYIGYTLLNNELMKRKNGVFAVKGIMAHEFGHILQTKLKCELQGSQRELHADFLAGYYVAMRGEFKTEADLTAFAESLYEKGDSELWDESHHGTSEQRLKVMLAGFESSEQIKSPQEAYILGIKLLTNDGDNGNIGQSSETAPSVNQRETQKQTTNTQKPKYEPQREKQQALRFVAVTLPDGIRYEQAYSVKFEAGSVVHSGMLVLKNGVGKMRLYFKDPSCGCEHLVEQKMVVKTSSNGTYIEGANPYDVHKQTRMATYNPDNFYFVKNKSGETEIWNVDLADNKAQVLLTPLTNEKDADWWLEDVLWD